MRSCGPAAQRPHPPSPSWERGTGGEVAARPGGVTLLLALVLLVPAAPARAGDWSLPLARFERGEELHFAGEIVEVSERHEARFRRASDFALSVFVLDATPGYADCAVVTVTRPRLDDRVSGPVSQATGVAVARPGAAFAVELVRIDYRGRAARLRPNPGVLPLARGEDCPTSAFEPLPLDGVPAVELGFAVPLPAVPVTLGSAWDVADAGRPPLNLALASEAVWNGGRAVEISVSQQSSDFDSPEKAVAGWRRRDTLVIPASDGRAAVVSRRTETRHGKLTLSSVDVRYERRPTERQTAARWRDTARELELAWSARVEFEALRDKSARAAEYQAPSARLERARRAHPAGACADLVEAVAKRYQSAASGQVPPPQPRSTRVAEAAPTPARLKVGASWPDLPLKSLRDGDPSPRYGDRPAVVVTVRPGARTSAEALAVAAALHERHGAGLAVVVQSVYEPPSVAAPLLSGVPAGVAVVDATPHLEVLCVRGYPRFDVLDRAGKLAWQFDGVGPEVGFLVEQQVRRLIGGSQ